MDSKGEVARTRRLAEFVAGLTGIDRVRCLRAADARLTQSPSWAPLRLAARTIVDLRHPCDPSLRVTRYLACGQEFEPVIDLRQPGDVFARFDPDRVARFSPRGGDRSVGPTPLGFVPA